MISSSRILVIVKKNLFEEVEDHHSPPLLLLSMVHNTEKGSCNVLGHLLICPLRQGISFKENSFPLMINHLGQCLELESRQSDAQK